MKICIFNLPVDDIAHQSSNFFRKKEICSSDFQKPLLLWLWYGLNASANANFFFLIFSLMACKHPNIFRKKKEKYLSYSNKFYK